METATRRRSPKDAPRWSDAQVRRTAARIVRLEEREDRFAKRAERTGDPAHLARLDRTRAVIQQLAREVVAARVVARIKKEVRAARERSARWKR